MIQSSLVAGVYEQTNDRESAYETLQKRASGGASSERPAATATTSDPPQPKTESDSSSAWGGINDVLFGRTGPRGGRHPGFVDTFAKSAARSVGSAVAREITRGIFGSLLGTKWR